MSDTSDGSDSSDEFPQNPGSGRPCVSPEQHPELFLTEHLDPEFGGFVEFAAGFVTGESIAVNGGAYMD